MSSDKPPLRLQYAHAAEAFFAGLSITDRAETVPQAAHRMITLASLRLLEMERPEVQDFNKLLVQYPWGRGRQIRQVVPDNMIVLHTEPIQADASYDLPFQAVAPFWVIDYVSKSSHRKDYPDHFRQFERELKVPYYLEVNVDIPQLTLFRLTGQKYAAVAADNAGFLPLPELDLTIALREGLVRYWHQGQLLRSPSELQKELEQVRQKLAATKRQLAQRLSGA